MKEFLKQLKESYDAVDYAVIIVLIPVIHYCYQTIVNG